MTPRQRMQHVLNHERPDRVPCDFGGGPVTGVHVSIVYALRQALKLDSPGTPVKVIDPFQMLGEMAPDLLDALDVDTVELAGTGTFFGFKKANWKPWETFDGTPVLVPGDFNTVPNEHGDIPMYPQGDRAVPASGVMPKGGIYFDAILRGAPVDFEALDVEHNIEEFTLIPDDEVHHLARESERLSTQTDRALFAALPGGGMGDLAWIPGPFLKHPKGIRTYDDWLTSLIERPDFIRAVFDKQCHIAIENLVRLYDAVGNRLSLLFVTGADYGSQNGPSIAPTLYAELFAPFYARINAWIHNNTSWKAFMHSCGAVEPLIPHFIEAGFDVLNPVQCSAAGMDPRTLKKKYGDKLVFWGGGVDTQRTLPFGTPVEVRAEVRDRIRILGENGGFVFNTIHNIQPGTPVENVLAMVDAYRECRDYT